MQSAANTVDDYLAELPADRREIVSAVRQVIRSQLPTGYEEGMQYGMIGYFVPHSLYPAGYHCDPRQPLPFAGLASQKNYCSLYLFCIYTDDALLQWFTQQWEKAGKPLDMGKSCIRFRKLEALPLDVIGQTVARMPVDQFIAHYERSRPAPKAKSKRGAQS